MFPSYKYKNRGIPVQELGMKPNLMHALEEVLKYSAVVKKIIIIK